MTKFLNLLACIGITTATGLFDSNGYFGPGNRDKYVIAVPSGGKPRPNGLPLRFLTKRDHQKNAQTWMWKDDGSMKIALKNDMNKCIYHTNFKKFRVGNCSKGTQFFFNKEEGLLHLMERPTYCMETGNGKKYFNEPLVRKCHRGITQYSKCTKEHMNLKMFMDQGDKYLSKRELTDADWPLSISTIGGKTLTHNVTAHLMLVESFDWLPGEVYNSKMTHRIVVMIPDWWSPDTKNKAYMHLNGYTFSANDANGDLKDEATLISEMTAASDGSNAHFNEAAMIAGNRGSVAVFMVDIPSQPVKYSADAGDKFREESGIQGFAWMFMLQQPHRFDYLTTLAQAKMAIKGFNAVQSWVLNNYNFWLDEYVVGGVSKRGWTALVVGFADKRVIGINPTVFDFWGIGQISALWKKSLGNWSFTMYELYIEGVPSYLDKIIDTVGCYVDPMNFIEEFKERDIPIYHNGASGDEFFLVQGSRTFSSQLRDMGVDYNMHTLVNTNHFLMGYDSNGFNDHLGDINGNFFRYAAMKLSNKRMPKYWYWIINNEDGTHTMKIKTDVTDSDFTVVNVMGFTADTSLVTGDPEGERMDFRLSYLDTQVTGAPAGSNIFFMPGVTTETVTDQEEYKVTVDDKTGKGFRATIVQITFLKSGANPTADNKWVITTPPLITPWEYNFEDCPNCQMTLVK